VGVNRFPGADDYDEETVRDALALPADCPLVWMDARDAESSSSALVTLVEHALARTAVAG
jgi:signal recognition particle receptor subunit beta